MSGKHQTTNASHLRALMVAGVSSSQMAETFGVHKTAVNRWLDEDKAPKWTVPASKAFGTNSAKLLIIGVIDKDKWKVVEQAIIALGLEKIGQRNL